MNNQTVESIRYYIRAYHELHGVIPDVRSNNGWIRVNGNPKSYRPCKIREMGDQLRQISRNEGTTAELRAARMEEINNSVNRITEQTEREQARQRAEEERTREQREMIMRLRENVAEESSVWDVREELNARFQAQIREEAESLFDEEKDNPDIRVKSGGWKEYVNKNTIIAFLNGFFEKAGHSAYEMQRMMDIFIHSGKLPDEVNCDECDARMEAEYLRKKLDEQQNNVLHYRRKFRSKQKEVEILKGEVIKAKQEIEDLRKNSVIFSMDLESI